MHWINEIRKDIASINATTKDLKKFGLLVGGVFLIISGLAIWRQWWTYWFISIPAVCGVMLVLFGILLPIRLKKVHYYWMGFAYIMGSIVSRIILFIIFYLILTPIAVTARVFNKSFFLAYKEKKRSSYWIDRENNKNINYERMS